MMERILTPIDFGKTIPCEIYQIEFLFSPNPDIEPEIRKIIIG